MMYILLSLLLLSFVSSVAIGHVLHNAFDKYTVEVVSVTPVWDHCDEFCVGCGKPNDQCDLDCLDLYGV